MKEDDFIVKYIGKTDITNVKEELLNETENNWSLFDFRKSHFIKHRYTHTIPLLWMSNKWIPNIDELVVIQRFIRFNNYLTYVQFLYDTIMEPLYPDCVIVKAMFVSLSAHEMVEKHTDNGDALRKVHRCHLAIKTNRDVIFTIDEVPFHFSEGELVEINNIRPHYVANNSDENRIHLIVDLLEKEWLPGGFVYREIDCGNMHKFEM
jgi:hypothetical protein